MQIDWEIKSRSHQCTRTGRAFEEGEFFYTLLFRQDGVFAREDICEEAWRDRNDNLQPFSFWKTKYEPPAPPPPEPIKGNDAEGLLRALIAGGEPRHQNVIYVLALMLERKKVLRVVDAPDDETLIYEHPGTGETFILRNPNLSLDQVPAVQREVAALLDESMSIEQPQPA